ncbi:MAG: glycosyltransferase family 2 protein [Geminicoccaceae bacterium]|nr:MAG: glycosyltransferase family 2 protein [Geminicoccaceae bacterium]
MPLNPPFVSLIVPAFRTHDTIVRCVRSALAQTWPHWELVVASDDGTDYLATLRANGIADARIRQVSTGGVGTGSPSARNAALRAAEGAVIGHLDADDAMRPDRLERLLPLVEAHGAAVCNTAVHDPAGRFYKQPLAPFPVPRRFTTDDLLTPRVPFACLFRRDLQPHGWTPTPFAGDVLINLELLSAAPTMQVHPEALYLYYKRFGSTTLAPDAAERADRGYATILGLLAGGGLRLSEAVRLAALRQFTFDQRLNRLFSGYLAEGRVAHLEDFLDLTDCGRAPWVEGELERCEANR